MTTLSIPDLALVVLVGPSGAGKSSFARRCFKPSEVLSSDAVRAMVRDDELDMSGNADAFEVLHAVARKRLAHGLLTVVDATNVSPDGRRPLVEIAREYHALPVAIVFDLPVSACIAHNDGRPGRDGSEVYVRRQHTQMRASMGGRSAKALQREGFRKIHVLDSAEEAASAVVVREPLFSDRRGETGPFDVIGDVHGCRNELETLLAALGYACDASGVFRHAAGRRAIFLGDLVDRGPDSLGCLRIVRAMVGAGSAFCVPGNHDVKLARKLSGRDVRVSHGLERTLAELDALPADARRLESTDIVAFVEDLVSHLVLDGGRLVVAHAGMKASMQRRGSAAVRDFALYGETTGEIDEYGLPVRADWAADYRGTAAVVYGHTPVVEAEWVNGTICIDTGCVFGGKLTALRWPERELVSTPASREHYPPARPPKPPTAPGLTTQQVFDDDLDLADLAGKRMIETRLARRVVLSEGETAAAIEVLSRFAAHPKWLVYLPPTMSPCETSDLDGLLEHPAQAFAYFRSRRVPTVVCQEKHMGSRAVVVVCRDESVARTRFGVENDGAGIVYTRTGRRFFEDRALEAVLLERLRAAIDASGLWTALETGWMVLDCELMPWSAKALELLRSQYASVGSAARGALASVERELERAVANGVDAGELLTSTRARRDAAERFTDAYRRYCWDVEGVEGWKLAPFHVLACESGTFLERPHSWHMQAIDAIVASGPELLATTRRVEVDLADPESERAATRWWTELTESGGEGMVVKPASSVAFERRGLVQPALKVRGPEYLRIIYGPEYRLPAHLPRLRERSVASKRRRAVREFALGVEGLERFVRREPLRRVHECALGVLALESEPVDPRL